jgi:hypothetical protein
MNVIIACPGDKGKRALTLVKVGKEKTESGEWLLVPRQPAPYTIAFMAPSFRRPRERR